MVKDGIFTDGLERNVEYWVFIDSPITYHSEKKFEGFNLTDFINFCRNNSFKSNKVVGIKFWTDGYGQIFSKCLFDSENLANK